MKFASKRNFSVIFLLVLLLTILKQININITYSSIINNEQLLLDNSIERLCISTQFIQNDSYILHNPISIYENDDFISYGFPGNGTEENPYRIENYNITTDSDYGIFVGGVTDFFVVQHCFVNAQNYGIKIAAHSYTGRIYDNICCNSTTGIYISGGSSTIINNTCYYNKNGIVLTIKSLVINNNCCYNEYGIVIDNRYSVVKDNLCYNNTKSGIYLDRHSDFTAVLNNEVYSNKEGIHLEESQECNISQNTLSSNFEGGIRIYKSQNSSILSNIFTNDSFVIEFGLDLRSSINYTIENNLVNGKPLGFFANLTKFTISEDYGQILMINCTKGIIADQHFSNTLYGISLFDCSQIHIKNCFFESNFGSGIRIEWSLSLLIYSNNFTRNYIGVLDLQGSNRIVYNNFIENANYAISAIINPPTIHHNNFIDNNQNGSTQAYSESPQTTWYDKSTLEGNYWSDWDGEGTYKIGSSSDLFPLSEPVENFPTDLPLAWTKTATTRTSFPIEILLCLALFPFVFKRRKN